MKKYLIVTADTNDGDYVTDKSEITEEQILIIQNVCKVLKKDPSWGTMDMEDRRNSPERFVKSGKLTQEEVDTMHEFCPSGEYGIHTIESVEIIEVINEVKLL